MWNRRTYRWRLIATLLIAVHLAGCYSWRATTTSPAEVIAEEQPSAVRVTLTDGTRLTLDAPTIRGDSIGRVAALSDVRTIEVRRFSIGKTVGLVLGAPLVGLVSLLAYFSIVCSGDACK